MAVEDLGITEGSSLYPNDDAGVRVYEKEDSSGPRDVRLVWSTEQGSSVQKEFVVTVRVKGRFKGSSYETEWKTYSATFAASQCRETQPFGGRVRWSVKLGDVGTLLSDIAGASGWKYNTRVYDSLTFRVEVYSNWVASFAAMMGYGSSNTAYAELYLSYLPEYHLTDLYYESSDLIVIEYSTTWTRQDDRFCITVFTCAGQSIIRGEYWYAIAAPGRLEVPTSWLTRHIKGQKVFVTVAFNQTYRPRGYKQMFASGTFTVSDHSQCNTATLRVVDSGDPYSVWIKTGDSGDLDSPITDVTVKLRSERSLSNEVTVPAGEIAKMRCCPFNEPLVFDGIGTNGYSVSQKMATVTAQELNVKGVIVLDSCDDESMRVLLRFNTEYSVTAQGECETMKFAGRSRPCSFYGTGGSTSVSVSGVLLDDTAATLERMVEIGDIYVRFPDSRAYRLAASASISCDFPRLREVSVSGDEVSDG